MFFQTFVWTVWTTVLWIRTSAQKLWERKGTGPSNKCCTRTLKGEIILDYMTVKRALRIE